MPCEWRTPGQPPSAPWLEPKILPFQNVSEIRVECEAVKRDKDDTYGYARFKYAVRFKTGELLCLDHAYAPFRPEISGLLAMKHNIRFNNVRVTIEFAKDLKVPALE